LDGGGQLDEESGEALDTGGGIVGVAQGGKEVSRLTKDVVVKSIKHHFLQPVISRVRHMYILHHAQQLQGSVRLALAELRLYKVNQVGHVSLPWGDPHVLSVSQCPSQHTSQQLRCLSVCRRTSTKLAGWLQTLCQLTHSVFGTHQ